MTQYPPQGYYPPQESVTRKPLSIGENLMHLVMTFLTAGLWLFIWIPRAIRGRQEITRYPWQPPPPPQQWQGPGHP